MISQLRWKRSLEHELCWCAAGEREKEVSSPFLLLSALCRDKSFPIPARLSTFLYHVLLYAGEGKGDISLADKI